MSEQDNERDIKTIVKIHKGKVEKERSDGVEQEREKN